MTRIHYRDFNSSRPIITLRDGSTLKTWKNTLGVDRVFLGDRNFNRAMDDLAAVVEYLQEKE
jgi:3-deoxy-D-manno-octulosonate 8-phosphate phosphatase KdsC-like HAD superfamily phosphatase